MEEIIPWTFMSNDLVKAVYNGDVNKCEELINEGADINVCDTFGNSLLWHAYIKNYHEIIFILLNAGVDVNLKSGNLCMCDMHRACAFGNLSFAELLLTCDGNVNIEDVNGKTPLILSVECRYNNYSLELVNILIDKGAKINHQDSYGLSVLHYACQRSWLDAIEVFIKNNANPCLQNSIGYSPITYALSYICYTSPGDTAYKIRLQIAERLLTAINSDYKKIKAAIYVTKIGPNLNAVFDLIFYGLRSKKIEIINIGWRIFISIKFYNDFNKDICTVAKTMCHSNKSNFDIIYFLNNMQIEDIFDLTMVYISRLAYEQNVERANIIFYYCLITDEGSGLKRILEKHKNILIQSYSDVITLILGLKRKRPSGLKYLCRNVIRSSLKYMIRNKLGSLEIPNNLIEFVLLSEMYSLVGVNSFEALKKLVESL
jgi:ankyrin repeat protein